MPQGYMWGKGRKEVWMDRRTPLDGWDEGWKMEL